MRSILLTILLLAGSTAFASTLTAPIDRILIIDNAMLVYVYPAGGITSQPGCVGDHSFYSFSMTRPLAKEYLALLVSAQAQSRSVTFWGKNACQDQTWAETLDYFRLEP